MKLYEFEGKKLFKKVGIGVPNSFLMSSLSQIEKIPQNFAPVVVKVQVLRGDRAARGGIIICKSRGEIEKTVRRLIGSNFDGEEIKKVLVEEKIEAESEYYFSITYDTTVRAPVVLVSKKAGSRISSFENRLILNPLESFETKFAEKLLEQTEFPKAEISKLSQILGKLARLFFAVDARLAEINPLAKSGDDFIALDSKIILDDAAQFRHPDLKLPPRSDKGAKPTKAEIEAAKIDQNDHRGVAGSVYFDLEGDIGILASGGGGSLVALDGIIAAGGKPANYTEYSGNPPREKVYKLTKIVLSKKGLNGLLVAGAIANFTDIYETLRGFIEALREVKPKFPIVIRRAGPRDKEAFTMLKEVGEKEGFDFHLFDSQIPIDKAASLVVQLAKEYKLKG